MKKKNLESTFINMAIVLVSIAFLSSASLAYVYKLTKDKIEVSKKSKQLEAIKEVILPDYGNSPSEEMYKIKIEEGGELECYPAKQNGELKSVAVKTYTKNAFGGEMWLMVGMLPDGTINKISVIDQKETPGLEFGEKEKKLGIRASETRSLILTDCKVPAENLIGGRENLGAIHILNTLNRSRIVVGALGVGCAEGALKQAISYAKERKQFGQSIASFQIIQHKLAEMAVRVETAKLLVYKAAWLAGQKDTGKSVLAKFGAMAKYFAAQAACNNADDNIQICGGMGFMEEFGAAKRWRDSRILRIYEGTDEIQKNEIARILIKESAN